MNKTTFRSLLIVYFYRQTSGRKSTSIVFWSIAISQGKFWWTTAGISYYWLGFIFCFKITTYKLPVFCLVCFLSSVNFQKPDNFSFKFYTQFFQNKSTWL